MSLLTRRRLLATAAVVIAGGAGVSTGLLRPVRHRPPPRAPQALLDALDREHALTAAVDATLATDATLHTLLDPIRTDHVAHAAAFDSLLSGYSRPHTPSPPPPRASSPSGRPALLVAERQASLALTVASSTQLGEPAALLASVAACEAGHVELLR
jgi:hypothetical protein